MKTKFTTKKGTEIHDYRMLRKGDRWLVYDVSVEGLSLVGNYRGQFNKITSVVLPGSRQRMKTRNDEFGAPAPRRIVTVRRRGTTGIPIGIPSSVPYRLAV